MAARNAATTDRAIRVLNRGDRRSPQAMQDQADIVSMKHGNQAAYIRARLRRDAPEVAALVGRKIIATFA